MARFLTEEQQARRKEFLDLRTKVQGLREKVEPIKHEHRMNRLRAEEEKLTHFLGLWAPEKLPEPINRDGSCKCKECRCTLPLLRLDGDVCQCCRSDNHSPLKPIKQEPLEVAPAVTEPIKVAEECTCNSVHCDECNNRFL